MICILFRQENFVNLCYEIAVSVPHSLPVQIRRRLAQVFHYGGAHSGCGTSAVVWFILYVALATQEFIQNPSIDTRNNLILSYIIIVMFSTILAAAHPRFRVLFHDYFEAGHRYSGWIALITFWIHNGLVGRVAARQQGINTGLYFAKSPNFWFFCVSTSCTLLSWSRLRRHDVYPEVLSDHAIRLHFKYRPMQPFYGLKVSTKPLLEWHAFATIPDEDENGKINGFSVVVSNAGDWTRETIKNPPSKLWVRGYPLHGLLFTSRLFKKIVVVFLGLSLCVVVSALDSVIVATAIPTISSVFNAGSVVSWVPSAYLLTSTAFQPLYGRFSDIFGRKAAMSLAMAIFMTGNLISGFSKSIIQLIVARGIAGAGGGGIVSLMQIIVSDIVTLRER